MRQHCDVLQYRSSEVREREGMMPRTRRKDRQRDIYIWVDSELKQRVSQEDILPSINFSWTTTDTTSLYVRRRGIASSHGHASTKRSTCPCRGLPSKTRRRQSLLTLSSNGCHTFEHQLLRRSQRYMYHVVQGTTIMVVSAQ